MNVFHFLPPGHQEHCDQCENKDSILADDTYRLRRCHHCGNRWEANEWDTLRSAWVGHFPRHQGLWMDPESPFEQMEESAVELVTWALMFEDFQHLDEGELYDEALKFLAQEAPCLT